MNITVMVEISISYVNNLEKWENGYNQTFYRVTLFIIDKKFITGHFTN